jgi:hypothetical protein
MGKPIGREALKDALENRFQRQRTAAAIELGIDDPDSVWFEGGAGLQTAEITRCAKVSILLVHGAPNFPPPPYAQRLPSIPYMVFK